MTPSPVPKLHKEVPPRGGYLFPTPFSDLADITHVGVRYMGRWFQSQVIVPQGIFHWMHTTRLHPYAIRLSATLNLARLPNTLEIVNERYVIDGPKLEMEPVNIILPACRPFSFSDVLSGLQRRLEKLDHTEVVRCLEFLEQQSPRAFAEEIKTRHRLRDLLR